MQNFDSEELRWQVKRKHQAEAKKETDAATQFELGALVFCGLLAFGTWFWLLTLKA